MENNINDNPEIALNRLYGVVQLSSQYCVLCENASELTKEEFIDSMLDILPRIYLEYNDIVPEDSMLEEGEYFSNFLDEEYYESIRRHIETLLGEDDMFLETFEEDMKYSDTPIATSIAESLADIFQPLYNFVSIVKDSEGLQIKEAFRNCKEEFCEYWSQRLCNVLRALNYVKYSTNNP